VGRKCVERLPVGDIQYCSFGTDAAFGDGCVEELVSASIRTAFRPPVVVGGALFGMDPGLARRVKADAEGLVCRRHPLSQTISGRYSVHARRKI